jgi:hypothetical protein
VVVTYNGGGNPPQIKFSVTSTPGSGLDRDIYLPTTSQVSPDTVPGVAILSSAGSQTILTQSLPFPAQAITLNVNVSIVLPDPTQTTVTIPDSSYTNITLTAVYQK